MSVELDLKEQSQEIKKYFGLDVDVLATKMPKVGEVRIELDEKSCDRPIYRIKNVPEAQQLEAVKKSAALIRYIDNPAEAVQLEAVQQKLDAIYDIKDPSEATQLQVLKKDPRLFNIHQPWHLFDFQKTTSEAVQQYLVGLGYHWIRYMPNPSEDVQLAAIQKFRDKGHNFVEYDRVGIEDLFAPFKHIRLTQAAQVEIVKISPQFLDLITTPCVAAVAEAKRVDTKPAEIVAMPASDSGADIFSPGKHTANEHNRGRTPHRVAV